MLFFPLQPKAVAGIHPNRVGYPNFKQHGCHLSDAHAAQSGDVRKVLGSWRQRLVDPALLIGQVFYRQTAAYGHMGRTDIDLPWEKTDKVQALKDYLA